MRCSQPLPDTEKPHVTEEAKAAFIAILQKCGIPKLRYDGSEPADEPEARRTEAVVNLNHLAEPASALLSVIPTQGRGSWIRDDVDYAVQYNLMPERYRKKALLCLYMWEIAIPTEYWLLIQKFEREPFHKWYVTEEGFMHFQWNTAWGDYEPLLVETAPRKIPVSAKAAANGPVIAKQVDYVLGGVYHADATCGFEPDRYHWDILPILKPLIFSRVLVNQFFTMVLNHVKLDIARPGAILAGDARWLPEFEKQGLPNAPQAQWQTYKDSDGNIVGINVGGGTLLALPYHTG